MADETTQGVHDFTVGWWNSLPATYRSADRVQGYRLNDAWEGLNRDPRFITGFDSWHRINTSTEPWEATVDFTRTFDATPHVPLHIRSWHHPTFLTEDGESLVDLDSTRVRHVVRNYTGHVIADEGFIQGSDLTQSTILEGGGIIPTTEDTYDGGTATTAPSDSTTSITTDVVEHHTVVIPDKFGTVHVTVQVTIEITDPDLADKIFSGPRNMIDAIHVGHFDTTFAQLPAADYFATAAAYPLLRYMDGIGHQAGWLSDQANAMHDGTWTNPLTAPEIYLPLLASVLGVPGKYITYLTAPQLREHLVDLVNGDSPTPGSREHIAVAARQWLTGDKEVSVAPAHTVPTFLTTIDKTLVNAVGYELKINRLWVQPTAPDPAAAYSWAGTPHAAVSNMYRYSVHAAENLVRNPGFANDLASWSTNTTVTATHDTTVGETYGTSAKLLPNGAGWYFLETYRNYPEAGRYVLRMRVRSEVEQQVRLRMWQYDGGTSQAGPVETITPGQWHWMEMMVTVYDPAHRQRPSIMGVDPYVASPLWVDRVYVARETKAVSGYFDGETPDSTVNDIWVRNTADPATFVWDPATSGWVAYTATDVTAERTAVINARAGVDSERLHTLIITARADQVPNNDLPAFAQFLNDVGVIPAGHKVVVREGKPPWDAWEAVSGVTWDDQATTIQNWNDSDSAGVDLN